MSGRRSRQNYETYATATEHNTQGLTSSVLCVKSILTEATCQEPDKTRVDERGTTHVVELYLVSVEWVIIPVFPLPIFVADEATSVVAAA